MEHPVRLDAKMIDEIKGLVHASVDRSTKAMLAHKADAVAEEFSEKFSSEGGDFTFESRSAIVDGLNSGSLKYESIKSDIKKVDVVAPNMAVVTGTRTVKGVIKGDKFEATFPFKAVHAFEGGKWKVALWAVGQC